MASMMMKSYHHLRKGAQQLKKATAELYNLSLSRKENESPSQRSDTFICGLCLKPNQLKDLFDFKGCPHLYCTPCIVNHVVSNLRDGVVWTIQCPVQTCTGILDSDYCRSYLPSEVYDSWTSALDDHINSYYGAESSNSSAIFECGICADDKHLRDSFSFKGCDHFYCNECIVNHVVSKLDNNVTSIVCPDLECKGKGVLDPQYCRPILPRDVHDRWEKALCESLILGSGKVFYCPFRDCLATLVLDGTNKNKWFGTKSTKNKAQCPHCKRIVCLKCKAPWHTEFDCAKFQKLEGMGEDELLKELAKKNKWRRCPTCNYYVEKKDGCSYMRCRCSHAFCYNCGRAIAGDHTYHCSVCKK